MSAPPDGEDPFDYVDFDDVLKHGDPSDWTDLGDKPGSPVPAHSRNAPPGTLKVYRLYRNEHGDMIELHYFRHPDGTVADVKVKPPTK